MDGNLVEAGAAIETDEPKLTVGVTEVIQGVIAAGNWVLEGEGDGVKFAVADAHPPNKIVNVGDSFLVRLGCEDKRSTPSAATLLDPAIVKQRADLILHDLAFEDAIAWLTTADWSRSAGIDAEVEAENRADNAAVVEAIPVFVDGGDEQVAELGLEVGRDSDIFIEFGLVAGSVPRMEVGADNGNGGSRRASEGSAVLAKKEQAFVDVVGIVEWLVTIGGLRSPNLGRKGNNVGARVKVLNRVGASSGQEGESNRTGTVSREVEDRNGYGRVSQRTEGGGGRDAVRW
jgi:hypothetical protein